MGQRKKATTELAIKRAKPEPRQYKMGAGRGMYLLVTPNGSKLWRLKYRFDGKEKTLSFGAYPEISLSAAIKLREAAREQIALGVDPNEKKKEERAKLLLFSTVAERWYSENTETSAKPWAEKTKKKVRLYLNNDILPTLGDRPIAEITRGELVALNESVESRGVVDAAAKIRQWLAAIFDSAYDREEILNNPAIRLKPTTRSKGHRTKHHPTVSFEELPDMMRAVLATNVSIASKLAIQVMLVTAPRPGELRLAKWPEFDFDKKIWTVPASRMKMRIKHIIPLPTQAIAHLKKLKKLSNSKYVLPNTKGLPISDATINKAFKIAGYGGRQTGHGIRHLLSTELNERGYNKDWIEVQLAHKVTDENETRGVYNHAIYLKQRAKMMQEWADSIDVAMAK